ncbi:MAG: hypothetical protein HYR60_11330 [Acidobacteria bacterium]|nr:hypothetical protein [Acidobacteriota bacterium]
MRAGPLGVLLCVAAAAQSTDPPLDPRIPEILRRIAEEADVFARIARDVISEETLTHRFAKGQSRFKPRVGSTVMERPKVRYETKEIVSEYGFGALAEAPSVLHEFRQVTAVDGRPIVGAEKARRTLSVGLRSNDDHVKKQMLKDFAKHGLVGTVGDFGQMLLMFSRRRVGGFQFDIGGESQLGVDPVLILNYVETSGKDSLTVFEGRETIFQPLIGQLWVRKSDYLPLKITLASQRYRRKQLNRSEASVEYALTAHGVVLPVSVSHKETVNGELFMENRFRYAPFRKFAAETELKFDVVEMPPEPAKK